MKYKILQQFNPGRDILNESKLKELRYDIGSLKKNFTSKKMQHISNLNPDKESIFYNFIVAPVKRNIKNSLIFLPDCAEETWELLKVLDVSNKKKYYYFIDNNEGARKQEISAWFENQLINPFNFINYFRKSSFADWQLSVLYSDKLNLENIVLNIFMSLGADVRPCLAVNKKMIFLKNVPLSFQHSIDLYKLG